MLDTPERGNLMIHPVVPGSSLTIGDIVSMEGMQRVFRADLARHGLKAGAFIPIVGDILTDSPKARDIDPVVRNQVRWCAHVRAILLLSEGKDESGGVADYSTFDRVKASTAVLGQVALVDAPPRA